MTKGFFNNKSINHTIKEQLNRKLLHLNNITYAYAIMSKRNPFNFSIISNKEEWFRFYIDNNLQFIDPVLITASNCLMPFSWDENIVISRGFKLKKIFDIAKNHEIINGYTFVLHDPYSNLAVLSIITDKNSDNDIEKKITNSKGDLQLTLLDIHDKTTSLYKKFNNENYFQKMNSDNVFSARENEIIYWSSLGKSYAEIAIILGIKLTTVKFHMGNVVKKLGVTNAKHAISIAVELKLINPIKN